MVPLKKQFQICRAFGDIAFAPQLRFHSWGPSEFFYKAMRLVDEVQVPKNSGSFQCPVLIDSKVYEFML